MVGVSSPHNRRSSTYCYTDAYGRNTVKTRGRVPPEPGNSRPIYVSVQTAYFRTISAAAFATFHCHDTSKV